MASYISATRAYYPQSVLYNWPSDKCVEIPARIEEVMHPDHCRHLLNVSVIPSTRVDWVVASPDMAMLLFAGAKERTEQDW